MIKIIVFMILLLIMIPPTRFNKMAYTVFEPFGRGWSVAARRLQQADSSSSPRVVQGADTLPGVRQNEVQVGSGMSPLTRA